MNEATKNLPEAIRLQAERILHDIENAGSIILAVKNGAKADGFVLGIMCSEGLPAEHCEILSAHFDTVTEKRLRLLGLGI